MPLETFLALSGFAIAASLSPGPNNMMVFASGVNFGYVRSLPHICGIAAGFAFLLACVGAGLGALLTAFPALFVATKFAGGAYLVWIAWKIATTRSMGEGRADIDGRPLTFLQAAAFQWVNPKAWIMGMTAMALYTSPSAYVSSVAMVAGFFGFVSLFSVSVWAGFGSALSQWLAHPTRLKIFNIAMAILLVASLWPMLR
ncbi:LysE family translocator [Martelella alba]|uniref:LysE family translocator n=1 Tax=Martelella alba TaxID=2590451 RepID=A0A506UIL7_9HYPH|nr:LysE family translocator [Martelella alba]TPW33159.1 LysE family translocator [Martelella alba]